MINAIAAVSNEWGIGKDNRLLFHIKEDMSLFKKLTTGHTVIMGRKTFESLPGKSPLKDRRNIILTGSGDMDLKGALVSGSIEAAVEMAGDDEIFVIGGGSVYREMLPYFDRVYITKVDAAPECDTYFPDLDKMDEFELISESEVFNDGRYDYKFLVYERVK